MESIAEMATAAKAAARILAAAETNAKNDVLQTVASRLTGETERIIQENRKDLDAARNKGLSGAMIDRLTVTPKTIAAMARGLCEVAELPDPVGRTTGRWTRPNGLQVSRVGIPLGVIGMIYESRPNVTIDAAGLCFKSGNAVILRGGSEAFFSNRALSGIFAGVLAEKGFPRASVQWISQKDREAVNALLQQTETVDLIIPRGGEGLIRFVAEHSRIPVLKHYKGVCHVYVDAEADLETARRICFNAKVRRPGVCNAMETMLVHEAVADRFLPDMAADFAEAGVLIRGCPKTRQILPAAEEATEEDWPAEYLDLILAVRVVPGVSEAVSHIACYGSNHTEAIVTADENTATRFMRETDASVVLWNASTRFNDGGELGLGTEIGISTTKLHAYGPMGLEELTTTRFVVTGTGQIRE